MENGVSVAYALFNLEERGRMFIGAQEQVYQGMIIGEHSRDNDLEVNPLKGKKLTNVRASGSDEAVRLTTPITMSLEEAIAYINDDELVEVTPNAIRLRKRFLDPHERKRQAREEFDRHLVDIADKIRKLREQDTKLSRLVEERRATLHDAEGKYASLEALQQADGSFGWYHGLQRYYLTSHAVFALHRCNGSPHVLRRGQVYLRNALPAMAQVGFLDGLLESLIMLRKMAVKIPDERRYSDYLRSRIKDDGSICFFDRPACRSDVHATSLLLEFLREFGD